MPLGLLGWIIWAVGGLALISSTVLMLIVVWADVREMRYERRHGAVR